MGSGASYCIRGTTRDVCIIILRIAVDITGAAIGIRGFNTRGDQTISIKRHLLCLRIACPWREPPNGRRCRTARGIAAWGTLGTTPK